MGTIGDLLQADKYFYFFLERKFCLLSVKLFFIFKKLFSGDYFITPYKDLHLTNFFTTHGSSPSQKIKFSGQTILAQDGSKFSFVYFGLLQKLFNFFQVFFSAGP